MNFKRLAEPFAPNEIEWRIGQAGTKANGEVWAKVLAYVTNRAIMDRLDEVCGAHQWRNEYRAGFSEGAVLCGISIKVGDEWITKWDGAENTDVEAVKGGLSNSMKRAAVQWGIGRYLYNLEEGWAKVGQDGEHYVPKNDKKGTPAFRWSPPNLPAWARPTPEGNEESRLGVEDARAYRSGPVPAPTTKAPAKVKPMDDPNIMPTGDYQGKQLGEVPTAELKALAEYLRAKKLMKYTPRIIALDDEINRRSDNARSNGELVPALVNEGADNFAFK